MVPARRPQEGTTALPRLRRNRHLKDQRSCSTHVSQLLPLRLDGIHKAHPDPALCVSPPPPALLLPVAASACDRPGGRAAEVQPPSLPRDALPATAPGSNAALLCAPYWDGFSVPRPGRAPRETAVRAPARR